MGCNASCSASGGKTQTQSTDDLESVFPNQPGSQTESRTDRKIDSPTCEFLPLNRQRLRSEGTAEGQRLKDDGRRCEKPMSADVTAAPASVVRRQTTKASVARDTDPTFVSVHAASGPQNDLFVFVKVADDAPATAHEEDEVTFTSSDGHQHLGVRVPSMNSSRSSMPMNSSRTSFPMNSSRTSCPAQAPSSVTQWIDTVDVPRDPTAEQQP